MGAEPDLRLTWSFLSAVADLWSSHPGTYKVVDEAADLVPALAQMSIKALAAEVRESVLEADQAEHIDGELRSPNGLATPITVRDVANKVVHGSPERVVVEANGEIRLYFVNSPNEGGKDKWTECWFSAQSLIDALHRLLYVRPHDSPERDQAVRSFIQRLGPERFCPRSLTTSEPLRYRVDGSARGRWARCPWNSGCRARGRPRDGAARRRKDCEFLPGMTRPFQGATAGGLRTRPHCRWRPLRSRGEAPPRCEGKVSDASYCHKWALGRDLVPRLAGVDSSDEWPTREHFCVELDRPHRAAAIRLARMRDRNQQGGVRPQRSPTGDSEFPAVAMCTSSKDCLGLRSCRTDSSHRAA